MDKLLLLVIALLLLAGLIRAERRERTGRILGFKTPLSLLFILAWFLQQGQNPRYAGMILAALWLCLAGDVLLAFGSRRTFLLGLASFLTGHLVYAAAFFHVGTTGVAVAAGAILMIAAGLAIWRWLGPHLQGMDIPVLAYMVVISIMVCAAASLAATSTIPPAARAGVLTGAVLFYLSDIFVARQRFVISAHINRQLGLPLYYSAQFLLAFSADWIPA